MKPVNKDVLKEAAHRLLFEMNDDEYETLLKEFEVISKQMDLISEIDGVEDVEPMTFPFPVFTDVLREDIAEETPSRDETLKNTSDVVDGMIKLPKVVR